MLTPGATEAGRPAQTQLAGGDEIQTLVVFVLMRIAQCAFAFDIDIALMEITMSLTETFNIFSRKKKQEIIVATIILLRYL